MIAGYHSKYIDNEQGFLVSIRATGAKPEIQIIELHDQGNIRQISTFEPNIKAFISIEKHKQI